MKRGLALTLLLGLTAEGLAAQPVIYAPRTPTPAEQVRFRETDRAMRGWAEAVRVRHRLDRVNCGAFDRLSCDFFLDGVSVGLTKPRRGSGDLRIALGMGNDFAVKGDRLRITSGAWIKPGDLFEVESGGKTYPYICQKMGEGENVLAQCREGFNFAEVASRAKAPQSHYVFGSFVGPAAAHDFVHGRLKIRHNGKSIRWPTLAAAGRAFAEQDFSKVIPR